MSAVNTHWLKAAVLALSIFAATTSYPQATAQQKKLSTLATSDYVELTPLKKRLTDRQLRTDIDKMVELHLRLDRLNTAGNPQAIYHQAQAYTWLEAARIEYLDNNPSGWESYAFNNAQRLATAIEQRQFPLTIALSSAAANNRFFSEAALKWDANKTSIASNAAMLGRQNVLLEWAAHEEQHDPNFVNTCLGHKFQDINKAAYPAFIAAIPAPIPTPAQPAPVRNYEFPDSVHFALDEYYLAPESKAILDKVVRIMREVPALKINAIGHTDPRAGQLYNQRLSERRVTIVRNYIAAQGIAPERINMVFKGETTVLAKDLDARGHARNRRTELSPQGGLQVDGATFRITNLEADLQYEKPGESREDNDKRRGIAPVKN